MQNSLQIYLVLTISLLVIGCGNEYSDTSSLMPQYGNTFRYKSDTKDTLRYEKGVVETFIKRILTNYEDLQNIDLPDERKFFDTYEQFQQNCRLDIKVVYDMKTQRHVYFNFDTYVLHRTQNFRIDPSPYEFRSLKHAFPLGKKFTDWRLPEGNSYERVTLSFQLSLLGLMLSRDVERNCGINL